MGKKKKEKTAEEIAADEEFDAMLDDFAKKKDDSPAGKSKKKKKGAAEELSPEPDASPPDADPDTEDVEVTVEGNNDGLTTTAESSDAPVKAEEALLSTPDTTVEPKSPEKTVPPSPEKINVYSPEKVSEELETEHTQTEETGSPAVVTDPNDPYAGMTKKQIENRIKKEKKKQKELEYIQEHGEKKKKEIVDTRSEKVKAMEKKQIDDRQKAEEDKKKQEELEEERRKQEELEEVRRKEMEKEREKLLIVRKEEQKIRKRRNQGARKIQNWVRFQCRCLKKVMAEIRERMAETERKAKEERRLKRLAEIEELGGDPDEADIEEDLKPKTVPYAIEPDCRPHLNLVFIGHVDAGKSTTCGNILYSLGHVDERLIEKYKREAKEKNRDSWFLAYIMDTSEEEKAKGKTVEVGSARFETANKRFTILDAPGHKSYVPNMITGASQADVAVLIISARRGEFEAGFEKGGQTREHALLIKSLGGVRKLIVAVNKMDDSSVEWSFSRYDDIVRKLGLFLHGPAIGFKEGEVIFLPISGLKGTNLVSGLNAELPEWVCQKNVDTPLLTILDELEEDVEMALGGRGGNMLRLPMLDGYKDLGSNMAIGKIEQGKVHPGMKCLIQPINKACVIEKVFIDEQEVLYAGCGENVLIKMHGQGLELENHLCKGFVLTENTTKTQQALIPSDAAIQAAALSPESVLSIFKPQIAGELRAVSKVKASFRIVELVPERPILTHGFKCVFHCHTCEEECEISKLLVTESISLGADSKGPAIAKGPAIVQNPKYARVDQVLTCVIKFNRPIAVDCQAGCRALSRFTLRDQGITVGIGSILELPK